MFKVFFSEMFKSNLLDKIFLSYTFFLSHVNNCDWTNKIAFFDLKKNKPGA